MAEDDERRQPAPVDGIAKARAALTEKDGVLEGDPGTVAENAKPAAGPVAPEGRAGGTAEGGAADGDGPKDG
jgi:hypothetical protein